MSRRTRVVCDCGTELPRPTPRECPGCGARIVAVRRRSAPWLRTVTMVVAMFAVLALFVWWMSG